MTEDEVTEIPESEDFDAEPGSFFDLTGMAYNRESYFRQF